MLGSGRNQDVHLHHWCAAEFERRVVEKGSCPVLELDRLRAGDEIFRDSRAYVRRLLSNDLAVFIFCLVVHGTRFVHHHDSHVRLISDDADWLGALGSLEQERSS